MPSGTAVYESSKREQYPSRSSRNSRLYREVYGKYEDIDNLPIEDNTDEIDMERLREIVYSSENTKEFRELKDNLDILDVRKRNIDTDRVYDINKILEKAKYENNKLKEPITNTNKYNKNILSTLQMDVIVDDKMKEEVSEVTSKSYEDNDNIYMTREFKFKELNNEISELNSNPLMNNVMDDSDLSLELFEDLKPTGNTIITKPIVDSDRERVEYKEDMHSSDTRDIDIIKPMVSQPKDEEFFTSSYSFSNKDFSDDQDDFFDEKKSGGNVIKIIFLLLAILVFSFVIVYFVLNYGVGA